MTFSDGALIGAEALVRWRHPLRGFLFPNEFIERAEETGLILPIGAWVLNEACRQTADWRQRFDIDLTIAVSVSGRQLREHDFIACVPTR